MRFSVVDALLWSSTAVSAQSFVSPPRNTERKLSERFPGASITYKECSLCETTKDTKSYSGYVHIPKKYLPDATDWEESQSAHLFFWYFQARKDPENAPTAIYLAGGPGISSLDFSSNFPCNVNPDSNSTTLNEFSWNNEVNMLYIDQPVGVGFSYVDLRNGTWDFLTGQFSPLEKGDKMPELNTTTIAATLDSGSIIVNTTAAAARTMWWFSQVWFQEFPKRGTDNDKISLWATSYGGYWGPGVFSHFLDQNDLIGSKQSPHSNATTLDLSVLGLGNGGIDLEAQMQGFPEFAINNTYGIQAYSKEVYDEAMGNLTAPETGCYALLQSCRAAAKKNDPRGTGANQSVNELCTAATGICFQNVQGPYSIYSQHDEFDITQSNKVTVPEEYRNLFFNQEWVLEELGVPLNFSAASTATIAAFFEGTGDPVIRDRSSLEHVLDDGVSVVLYHGDRDYRCNWFGAENLTLFLDFPGATEFRSAGYASIKTNETYDGGLVRQHGNLSFSRIFQAGHAASAYQPETMYRIFQRAMSGQDVATGKTTLSANRDYASKGPLNIRNVLSEKPKAMKSTCYLADVPGTCTEEQAQALAEGTAKVEDWIVIQPEGTTGEQDQEAGQGNNNSTKGGTDGDKAGDGGHSSGVRTVASAGTLVIALLAGLILAL